MSKRMMTTALAGVIAVAAISIALPARAQMGQKGWHGQGMMNGQGFGQGFGSGMMGPGYGPGMMGNYGPGMMGGCGMMGTTIEGHTSTFAAGRIAFLKAELGITDAQTAAWDAYADKIKGNLTNVQGMWQTMQAVFDAKTPADRLDAQIAAMESRVSALKEIKPALAKLYDVLSPDQKTKADQLLTGMGCMM